MQRKLFVDATASPGSIPPSYTPYEDASCELLPFATRAFPAGRALSPSAQEHFFVSSAGAPAGLRQRPRPAPVSSRQAPSWLPPGASLSKGSAAHRAHRAASAPYQRNQRRSTVPPNDRSPPPRASDEQSLSRWPTPPPPGNNITASPSATAWAEYTQAAGHAVPSAPAFPMQGIPALQPQEHLAGPTHWHQGTYGKVPSQTATKPDMQQTSRGPSEKAHSRPALAVITNTPQGSVVAKPGASQRQHGPGGFGCNPTNGRTQQSQVGRVAVPDGCTSREQQQPTTPMDRADMGRSPRLAPWLLTDLYDAGAAAASSPTEWQAAAAVAAVPPPPPPLQVSPSPPKSPAAANAMQSTWSAGGLPSPVGVLLASLGLTEAAEHCAVARHGHRRRQEDLYEWPGGAAGAAERAELGVGLQLGDSTASTAGAHEEPGLSHRDPSPDRSMMVPVEAFAQAAQAMGLFTAGDQHHKALPLRQQRQQQLHVGMYAGNPAKAAAQGAGGFGAANLPRGSVPVLSPSSPPLSADAVLTAIAPGASSMHAPRAHLPAPGTQGPGPGAIQDTSGGFPSASSPPGLTWLDPALFSENPEHRFIRSGLRPPAPGGSASTQWAAASASTWSLWPHTPQLAAADTQPRELPPPGPSGSGAMSPSLGVHPPQQPQPPAPGPVWDQHEQQQQLYTSYCNNPLFLFNFHDLSPELLRRTSPEPWAHPLTTAALSPGLHGTASGQRGSGGDACPAGGVGGGPRSSPRLCSAPSFTGSRAPPTGLAVAAGATAVAGPTLMDQQPERSPPIPAEWLEGVEELLRMLSPRPDSGANTHVPDTIHPGCEVRAGNPGAAGDDFGGVKRSHPLLSPHLATQHRLAAQQPPTTQQQQNRQQQDPQHSHPQQQQGLPLVRPHCDGECSRRSPTPSTQPTKQRVQQQQQHLHSRRQQQRPQMRTESRGRGLNWVRNEQGTADEPAARALSAGRSQRQQQQHSGLPLARARKTGASPLAPPPEVHEASRDHQEEPPPKQQHRQLQQTRQKQQAVQGSGRQDGRLPVAPTNAVQYSSFDVVASVIAGQLLMEAEQVDMMPSCPGSGGGGGSHKGGGPSSGGEGGDGGGGGEGRAGGRDAGGEAGSNMVSEVPACGAAAVTGGAVAAAAERRAEGKAAAAALMSVAASWSPAAGRPEDCAVCDASEASPGLQAVEEFLDRFRTAPAAGRTLPQTRRGPISGTAGLAAAHAQLPSVPWGEHAPVQQGPLIHPHLQQQRVQQMHQPHLQQQQQQHHFTAPLQAALLRVVQRVFAGWRRQVVLRRACAGLVHRRAQLQGADVLRAWRAATMAQQARHQASCSALIDLRMHRLLSSAWLTWRSCHAANLQLAHDAASRHTRSLLTRAVRGWVTVWARAASMRVLLRHRAVTTARACLAAWRQLAATAGAARQGAREQVQQEKEEGLNGEDDAEGLAYGLAVHRALRRRSCFRRWLSLTDAAVQTMSRQQALRHAMHDELLYEAALRMAADAVARHRYLAPVLHAWRALAASSASAAPVEAALETPPLDARNGSRDQGSGPPVGRLQLQVLAPTINTSAAIRREPPVPPTLPSQQQQPALLPPGGQGVVPWVMAGALLMDPASQGQGPHTRESLLVASDGAPAAGDEQSRRDSSSGSAGSFDFRWAPQHRQQKQGARGAMSRSVDMTPRVDRTPGQPGAQQPAARRGGSSGSGTGADSPLGGRAPAPSPADEESPHDLRRAFSTGSTANVAAAGRTGQVMNAPAPLATAVPADAALATPENASGRGCGTAGSSVPALIQKLSAGGVGVGTSGCAPLNTPPSVQATRLVQGRNGGQDGPGGTGGSADGLAGGREVLAELAPDVLLQLLESDLAWYTEQYLTPPRPEGRPGVIVDGRSGGGGAHTTTTVTATRTTEDPSRVAAAAAAAVAATTLPWPARAAVLPAAAAAHAAVTAAAMGTGPATPPQEASPSPPSPPTHTPPGSMGPYDDGWSPSSLSEHPGAGQQWTIVTGAAQQDRGDDHFPGAGWHTGASLHASVQQPRNGLIRSSSGVTRNSNVVHQELLSRGGQQQQRQLQRPLESLQLQPQQQHNLQGTVTLGDGFPASQGAPFRADPRAGRPGRTAGERRRSNSSGSGAAASGLGGQWPPMGQFAASPTASDDDLPYKRYVALPGDAGLLRLRGDRWQPAE